MPCRPRNASNPAHNLTAIGTDGPDIGTELEVALLIAASSSRHRSVVAACGMARTCRDAILEAFDRLERAHGRRAFALAEIVTETLAVDSAFAESTIRTHVSSRMCADAPDNHGTVYADLERVAHGQYRRR